MYLNVLFMAEQKPAPESLPTLPGRYSPRAVRPRGGCQKWASVGKPSTGSHDSGGVRHPGTATGWNSNRPPSADVHRLLMRAETGLSPTGDRLGRTSVSSITVGGRSQGSDWRRQPNPMPAHGLAPHSLPL